MRIVGVQKHTECFRLAYVSIGNREIRIDGLETHATLAILEKNSSIVIGIEGQDLLMRHVVCPVKTIRAAHQTLPFQLEGLIPYPLEKVLLKPIYSIKEKAIEVLMFVIPKEKVALYIARYQSPAIDPDWISVLPMALFRFASFVCPEEQSLVVCYIGIEKMQLIAIVDGRLSSHVTLSMGAQDVTNIDLIEGGALLQREVERALCFLFRKHTGEEKEHYNILLCGEKTKEVESLLNNSLNVSKVSFSIKTGSVKTGSPFDEKTLSLYAVPIGLAIDRLKNDRLSVQLRQGEFLSDQTWTSIKKKWMCGGALALAFLVFGVLSVEFFYRKTIERWSYCVDQVVAQLHKQDPMRSIGSRGHSLEDSISDLDLLVRGMNEGGKEGSVFAPPPLVSHLLSFLSSHLTLSDMQIKHLDYTLKRYPSLRNPKEDYCPEVRLVFLCKDSKKAVEFRDAIMQNETVIDQDHAIDWKWHEDAYEITFFLRHAI